VRSGSDDVRLLGRRSGRKLSLSFGSCRERRSFTNREIAATTPTRATNSGKNSNSSTLLPLYGPATLYYLLSKGRSGLLPNKFVVSPPCSFANNPSRRGLDRPPVTGDRRGVAPHRRRQTPCSAIG